MAFSAVILAGGQSQRMGRDKAFLEFEGQPLLGHQLKTVASLGPAEILISGRENVDYRQLGYPVVRDAWPDCGPLAGLERALAKTRSDLLLVLAVDLPHMTSDFLRQMLTLAHDHEGVVPQGPGGLEPLAAIYPTRAHDLALEGLRTGRRALWKFVKSCESGGLVRIWPYPAQFEPLFANWNSPEDIPDSKP